MTEGAALVIITTTVSDQAEAVQIAHVLVEQRLVACAQIEGPIESVYWWEGQVESSTEWRLVLKTTAACEPSVRQRVMELHSYQVPQWVVVKAQAVPTAYEHWVQSACSQGTRR